MFVHTLLKHNYGDLFSCVISFLHIFSLFPVSHCFVFPRINDFPFYPLSLYPWFTGLVFFSWLLPLARNSSTVLNRSDASIHPCFVLDLRVEAFSPSLLSIILAVSFSQMLSIPNLLRDVFGLFVYFYIRNICWKLSNTFPPSIETNHVFPSLLM